MKKLFSILAVFCYLQSAIAFETTPIEKVKDKAEYITILGDPGYKAKIRLGDKTSANFVPEIDISRWNGEAFLILRDASVSTVSKKEMKEKDKIWVEDDAGTTHRLYVLPDGNNNVLEYEQVFQEYNEAKKEIRLNLAYSPGLSFHYQPELTAEEIAHGANRPPRVVGSYAVYYGKRDNQYKTGKFCHIYRWEVIDATGKREWCGNLSIVDEQLIIPLPQAWLKTATYPVVAMGAGDTFGLTAIGGSDDGYEEDIIGIHDAGPGQAGDATSISIYTREGTSDDAHTMYCALYEDSADGYEATTQAFSTIKTAAGWYTPTFSSPHAITDKGYIIACWNGPGAGKIRGYYDTVGAAGRVVTSVGTPNGSNWPDPYGGADENRQFSIYVTYTPSGGGGGTVYMHPIRRFLGDGYGN